jgi:hypothetical protein
VGNGVNADAAQPPYSEAGERSLRYRCHAGKFSKFDFNIGLRRRVSASRVVGQACQLEGADPASELTYDSMFVEPSLRPPSVILHRPIFGCMDLPESAEFRQQLGIRLPAPNGRKAEKVGIILYTADTVPSTLVEKVHRFGAFGRDWSP